MINNTDSKNNLSILLMAAKTTKIAKISKN